MRQRRRERLGVLQRPRPFVTDALRGGNDAPEIAHAKNPGRPFVEEARDHLDHMIGGKTVRVDAYGPDRNKQVLAVVWDGEVNVNLLMVAMGYTEV